MKHVLKPLATLAAVVALVAACGDDTTTEPAPDPQGFNNADVQFATDMIPHHAQALSMVDLTMGKNLSPKVLALAEEIRMAQSPEIERMVRWLTRWGKPIPRTGRDHSGHDMGPMDMPGMATMDDLAALEGADGRNFERMFLTMMIEHHQGAIQMARTELSNGQNAAAKGLAQDIVRGQQGEIARMEQLLRD